MSYIEITIWNPFKEGNFTLEPKLQRWPDGWGWDFEWLFVSVQVSFWTGESEEEAFQKFMDSK